MLWSIGNPSPSCDKAQCPLLQSSSPSVLQPPTTSTGARLIRDRLVRAASDPDLAYASESGDARCQLRASDSAAVDVGKTRQLTLNLNLGAIASSFAAELLARLFSELSSL
jgi:hypothetical protein